MTRTATETHGRPRTVADAIAWCRRHLPRSPPGIITGAAEEGALVLAQQVLGDREASRTMVARFRERFPFIEVASTTAYAVELVPMLKAEVRDRRGVHDHFQISSDLAEAAALRRYGALARFVVSEDAAYPEPARFRGYWYARTRAPVVTIYRTGALSQRERRLVRSYAGLGDACFRGRLGILDVSAAMAAARAHLLMTQAEPGTWDGIAANRPQVLPTGGPLLQGLLAGAYDVAAFGPLGTAIQAARSGQPVEFVASAPSPRIFGAPGVVSAMAPHPNAARLWADWSTSREGSELFAALTGHMSPRLDASRCWAEQQPWYVEDPAQVRDIDWAEVAARRAQVVARFRSDVGGA